MLENTMSSSNRCRSLGGCWWLWVAFPLGAGAADLSMLSDFGRPDIPQEVLGIGPGNGNMAGIFQSGTYNIANIQQALGLGNNAEVWQSGTDLAADVSQRGSANELRLSQALAHQRATLTQDGVGNQMAIQQLGINAELSGSQIGDGNQLVLQQQNDSQFIFSQTGNQNQIVVELPSGMALQVDQVGNNLSFQLHPN